MKKLDTYEFTLVLGKVDDQTQNLEDHLFTVGCDDALINFRHGTVYLDFRREAESIEDAVISAIKAIENSHLNATVINILPDELVNESEIGKRLNKSRQVVSLWVKKQRRPNKPFPNPVAKLSEKSPLWRWYDVVKWLYEQQLIKDYKTVEVASFIKHVKAVLEERDPAIKKYRHNIFNRLRHGNLLSKEKNLHFVI